MNKNLKNQVNMKAFSIVYNGYEDSLTIKYKGIAIQTLDYPQAAFNEDFKGNEPFSHYVKLQGKAIYEAIQNESLPEELLEKARILDEKKEGIENEEHWQSSSIFSQISASVETKDLKNLVFSTAAAAEILNRWDKANTTIMDNASNFIK